MRIGFDGRWFFSGNPSGKVIVRQLLRQLINLLPRMCSFSIQQLGTVFLPTAAFFLGGPGNSIWMFACFFIFAGCSADIKRLFLSMM
jgi:hypothetical protein